MADLNKYLDDAMTFLHEEVAPRANDMDHDPDVLRVAWLGLGKRRLLALRAPAEYGGGGLSEEEFRIFQEEVARTSGSLAFLQTQHQSAAGMIAKSAMEAAKRQLLPGMADGSRAIGIGFSQLRRPGPPLISSTPVSGGYEITGHVPWVTGSTYFQQFLLGSTLPTGEALFSIVPLSSGPGVTISPPMKLSAMDSGRTVTADFDRFFLPQGEAMFAQPMGWIQRNDTINITLQGFFALGCARAGLGIVLRVYEKRQKPFLKHAHDALMAEVEACRIRITDQDQSESQKLEARAWVIELATRCAHAAVTASGGAANSVHNDAQRVYREALVYTVSAQTEPIMEATLSRLSARGVW